MIRGNLRWLWASTLLALSGCGSAQSAQAPCQATNAVASSEPNTASRELPAPRLEIVDPLIEGMTVQGVTDLCDANLELAQAFLSRIKKVPLNNKHQLKWEPTLGRFDDAYLSIRNASGFPYLMGETHPDKAVRDAAQTCEKKTDELLTALWLDAELAAVVKAYAKVASGLNVERQRLLDHTLREFRRNGLELAPDAQLRLRQLNKEITELGQAFLRRLGEDQRFIEVSPEQLEGLPESYIVSHPPDQKHGKTRVTTDYPDLIPFLKYARDRQAAKELYIQFANRGGDANVASLSKLLILRQEKAKLLGYETWADYAIEPRMAKDAKSALAFLDRIGKAIQPAVKKELAAFGKVYKTLEKKGGPEMSPPDRLFLTDQLKNSRHNFDSKELAKYFEIGRVTRGLLDITAKMYGLTYKAVKEQTWHPSVDVYEAWSGSRKIGKFYLDMHPRNNKYKHAAAFTVRAAKTLANGTRQTPISALVCNFPEPGEPMSHGQVETYFHEFGHVLHQLLTDTELASFAGTRTARDFVEAPSQMFEEWAWSREVLDLFARHKDTGERLSQQLFERMTKARKTGIALATERQLWLARLDLTYHTQTPPMDTTEVLKQVHDRHFSFAYVPGTHYQSTFGHLISYDAGYYGYQWALALAHDVLSRFKKEGFFNTQTAMDWRQQVLAKGGSDDERELIKAFLGREPSEQAYADFLASEPQ